MGRMRFKSKTWPGSLPAKNSRREMVGPDPSMAEPAPRAAACTEGFPRAWNLNKEKPVAPIRQGPPEAGLFPNGGGPVRSGAFPEAGGGRPAFCDRLLARGLDFGREKESFLKKSRWTRIPGMGFAGKQNLLWNGKPGAPDPVA